MVNVSKKRLPPDISEKIERLFIDFLRESFYVDPNGAFLNEFFTEKERAQFSKRITIIYLLMRGIGYDDIGEIINVSSETVLKYLLYLNGPNLEIAKKVKGMVQLDNFFQTLDDLINNLYLMPGVKRGHLRKEYEMRIRKVRREKYGI